MLKPTRLLKTNDIITQAFQIAKKIRK